MDEKLTSEFMVMAAQVEKAQQRMCEQYQAASREYERLMNEAVARYTRALGETSGGSAAADGADAAAAEQPKSFEEGADDIFADIGTADS